MDAASAVSNIFDCLPEDEIDSICTKILSSDANAPEALRIAGILAYKRGQKEAAIALVEKACQLQQDNPYYRYDLAMLLMETDKASAVRLFSEAGRLFHLRRQFDDAMNCLRACLWCCPDHVLHRMDLALLCAVRGETEETDGLLLQVLGQEPDNALAALARACLCFPAAYRCEAEIAAVRRHYVRCLDVFCEKVALLEGGAGAASPAPFSFIGNFKPFGLPYQGDCDRDLQDRFGRHFVRYASVLRPERFQPRPFGGKGRIRVGFVSEYVRSHSVHKLFRGWMEHLDPQRFAVHVYAVGPRRPGSAPEAFLGGVENPRCASQSVSVWEETIAADRLDVLIYPEIGMGCDSLVLASRRLAPVQCVAWGHPETTGLPTMDYFLSSELMEPADAARHYTERLVLLPHLSIWYEPPCRPPDAGGMDRRRLGLDEDAFVFACTQTSSKYLPRYDDVFARIAAQAPEAQFLFLEHPTSPKGTMIFKERLEAAFAEYGLDAGRHCVFSPRLAPDAYLAMHLHVDAALDSIGWSGGVSLLEALAYDLPAVTLPVGLMRGRHGAAFLRRMGVAQCIASTLEGYVALAVRLARDKGFYRQARGDVARFNQRLYRDGESIRGLEAFLARVVGR
ncbi:hypothetical protein [Solidesulfovibrio sp.]|uniref:O-linked N-acetylglucosamine transferase, SPINDLY family protein n=1 Tax=Solidesulfovibrio sp. TaxID=2910990 RepID=UPI0026050212|nr:hypothetical protein [Solidesulfovibrio sp.]